MKVPIYTKNRSHHYLNGRWVLGKGEPFTSTNPADGQLIWQGRNATVAEVELACAAARSALPSWASLDFVTRTHYLQGFAQQISTHRQELAYLISLETGKPLWEAHTEVHSVIAKIELSIAAHRERNAEKKINTSEALACLRFKPQGIVAVLGAFNFPAHLSNGHIVPALLAGNTIVYKPSELAPAVAQFVMQCWHESKLPPGVINCVQGGSACGKALLANDIQAVFFTGSYAVGRQINRYFCDRPEILLALEMGGNNPLIVDKVENREAAIYHSLLSTLLTSGQRCTCARRVFIAADSNGERFLSRFIEVCKAIKIAAFIEKPEPFMGPVIRHSHAEKHLLAQQNLLALGGRPLITMSLLKANTGFLSPGIIDMTGVCEPPDEEIFAPLVQIYRYEHFSKALELANKTRYGLVAGLLSDDPLRYEEFYQAMHTGLINWNRPTTGAIGSLPFGGVGCSGNYRPSAYFAADYCAHPVASLEQPLLTLPAELLPGTHL